MTDSKGAQLQEIIELELRKRNSQLEFHIQVTVRIMEGVTLDNIFRKMNSKYYDSLQLVHARINNLTVKTAAKVQLVFDNIPELVDMIIDKITMLKNKLFCLYLSFYFMKYRKNLEKNDKKLPDFLHENYQQRNHILRHTSLETKQRKIH